MSLQRSNRENRNLTAENTESKRMALDWQRRADESERESRAIQENWEREKFEVGRLRQQISDLEKQLGGTTEPLKTRSEELPAIQESLPRLMNAGALISFA